MGSDVGQIFLTASLHRDHLISYALVCEKEFSHKTAETSIWKANKIAVHSFSICSQVSTLKGVIIYLLLSHITLKAPIKTAADEKFCDIFPNFPKKK